MASTDDWCRMTNLSYSKPKNKKRVYEDDDFSKDVSGNEFVLNRV